MSEIRRRRNIQQGLMAWHFKHRGGMTVKQAMQWFDLESRDQVTWAIKRLQRSGLDIREKRIVRQEPVAWGMTYGGLTRGRKRLIYYYLAKEGEGDGEPDPLG